jgi:hypothetical protein
LLAVVVAVVPVVLTERVAAVVVPVVIGQHQVIQYQSTHHIQLQSVVVDQLHHQLQVETEVQVQIQYLVQDHLLSHLRVVEAVVLLKHKVWVVVRAVAVELKAVMAAQELRVKVIMVV